MSRKPVTLAIWLLSVLAIPYVSCLSYVRNNNGGLENIVVRINEPLQYHHYNCTHFKLQLEALLTSTSDQLLRSTRGITYWKKIWVAIPPQWKNNNCFLPESIATPNWYRLPSADLIIDTSHPLMGDTPFAKQHGGCRVAGSEIRLSLDYVNNSQINDTKLLKEWLKYRYGVFSESGYQNDYQYPLTYSDSMITLPTNRERAPGNGSSVCDNGDTNATNTDRLCVNQEFHVCTAETHIKMAPTKQNVLCNELSYWEVLLQHPDFQVASSKVADEEGVAPATDPTTDIPDDTDTPPAAATQISYFVPDTAKYVLVLDRSSQMATASRWVLMRRALYRWVHSLPDDCLLGIIVAGEEASQVLPWTRVTSDNRDGLAGRIPRRPLTRDSFCLSCAVKMAAQMLEQYDESSGSSGSIVLVTGTSRKPEDFEEIRHFLRTSESTVHKIAFPAADTFAELSLLSPYGLNLAVQEATSTHEAALTQTRITQSLLQILREEDRDPPQQVYEKYHYARDGNSVLGTFTLDDGLNRNIWITAHSADEADLDTVEVVSPSGIVYDLPLVYDGLLYIRIAEANEQGEWSYRLRFSYPVKENASAAIEVTAQASKVNLEVNHEVKVIQGHDTFKARAWTSVGHSLINASQVPVILYAEVIRGQTAVVDAKVVALVRSPGQKSAVEIILHDKGTGDPDITRADGIYSAYFTHAVQEPGYYSVTVYVTDNDRRASIPIGSPQHNDDYECCGSSMPYSNSAPSGIFTRIVVGPSFMTTDGPLESEDVYPPTRIADLRVEKTMNSSNEIELAWTAPGGDYDSGTAAFYEIRCYTDRSTLNDLSSAILVHSSLTPVPSAAGYPERAVVAVPWPNQQFYYAVVAVDVSGNRGQVSNIVSAYIYEAPTTTTSAAGTSLNDSKSSDTSGLFGAARSNVDNQRTSNENQIYAIAGGVSGFVLLLLILSVAAFCSRRKGSSKKSQEPSKTSMKIQEENGDVKIITPEGHIIQQRGDSWFSTLPRDRSNATLDETNHSDGLHWSLPRSKNASHRHKVLTNGSIMQTGGGSQGAIGIPVATIADGTSISSKPSVSSEDTGIEVSDPHHVIDADSRESIDTTLLPPPGFGGYHMPNSNGYLPMYGNYLPNINPQNARLVRVANNRDSPDSYGRDSYTVQENYMQPSSRRPIIGSVSSSSNDDVLSNESCYGEFPQTPRKKRHISFV